MKLLQGNCIELMKDIPDGSIDMILCDPPYGTTRNKWDLIIDLEKLWGGVWRVLKDNGAALFFSQMPFTVDLINSERKRFRYEWIWVKTNRTGFLNARRMPLKLHENILVFYRHLPTYNPQKETGHRPSTRKRYSDNGRLSENYGKVLKEVSVWDGSDGTRFPTDVIKFNTVMSGSAKSAEPRIHPTQKPVPLLEYLIRTYTNEGETVLDMCMGSGSTGVACRHTGRDFVGMELDADYFKIAKQRIETEVEKNE